MKKKKRKKITQTINTQSLEWYSSGGADEVKNPLTEQKRRNVGRE